MSDQLLVLKSIGKIFTRSGFGMGTKTVQALDDVTMTLPDKPQVLALVGESGSGKTTLRDRHRAAAAGRGHRAVQEQADSRLAAPGQERVPQASPGHLPGPLLYITHDLNVGYFIADQIVILCLGKMVEWGESDHIVKDPLHPYTQELISSIPNPDPQKRWTDRLQAEKIGLNELRQAKTAAGCIYAARCRHVMEKCRLENPPWSA